MVEVKLTPSQRKLVEVSLGRMQETALRAKLEHDECIRVVLEEHEHEWPRCQIDYDPKLGLLKWGEEKKDGKLGADGGSAENGGGPARQG